ncbi:MAG: carboxymuconolactone decarboxylase family protein [Novipirellula sp. JB048]
MSEPTPVFPAPNQQYAQQRKRLAPEPADAFKALSRSVFAEGALSAKTKQLIAVAVAHVTQCPYCIKGHTKGALQHDATPEQIMEAIWVAAEMRAGAAYAHSMIALETISQAQDNSQAPDAADENQGV